MVKLAKNDQVRSGDL